MRPHSPSVRRNRERPVKNFAPPLVPIPRPKHHHGAPIGGGYHVSKIPSVKGVKVRAINPPAIVVSSASATVVKRSDKTLTPSLKMGSRTARKRTITTISKLRANWL